MNRTLSTIIISVLAVVVSTAVSYRFGQSSQDATIRSLSEQIAVWKTIREADEIKHSVVLAFMRNMTLDEFQKEIGSVREATTKELPDGDKDKTHVFVHPGTQRRFLLRFEDGKLMGYHSGYGMDEALVAIEVDPIRWTVNRVD